MTLFLHVSRAMRECGESCSDIRQWWVAIKTVRASVCVSCSYPACLVYPVTQVVQSVYGWCQTHQDMERLSLAILFTIAGNLKTTDYATGLST